MASINIDNELLYIVSNKFTYKAKPIGRRY